MFENFHQPWQEDWSQAVISTLLSFASFRRFDIPCKSLAKNWRVCHLNNLMQRMWLSTWYALCISFTKLAFNFIWTLLPLKNVAVAKSGPTRQGTWWPSCRDVWARSGQQPGQLLVLGPCIGACPQWIHPMLPQVERDLTTEVLRKRIIANWSLTQELGLKWSVVQSREGSRHGNTKVCPPKPVLFFHFANNQNQAFGLMIGRCVRL